MHMNHTPELASNLECQGRQYRSHQFLRVHSWRIWQPPDPTPAHTHRSKAGTGLRPKAIATRIWPGSNQLGLQGSRRRSLEGREVHGLGWRNAGPTVPEKAKGPWDQDPHGDP